MFDWGSLNPQQRKAVEATRGPVLILAGAGTGKTRVLTCRVAHLVEQGVPAGRVLAVTFTNKAAREMQQRVRQLLASRTSDRGSSAAERPTVCTFHSLCVRILRRYAERLGYKRNFVIYDEADQLGIVRKILSRVSDRAASVDPGAVRTMLSRLRSRDREAEAPRTDAVSAMAAHLRGRYESALRACNAMDFDDLILLTLRLFAEHPDALAECRRSYQYVMVDEYQDTNAAQFRLVECLTREHRNLCVVGDDDQSIYGWRGAEIANLLEMERDYPEVQVITLEQNYRSTNTILAAANAVIRHNARRRGKQLWSQRGMGDKLVLHTYANEEEEARAVADTVEFDRRVRRVPWSDQAVLIRTNGQSRPFETAFRQAGIRYHLVGGQSFFDRREIRDAVAYLKVLANPHDEVSLLRIANVPARGLSDSTLERLLEASQEQGCSVYAIMCQPPDRLALPARTQQRLSEFVQFLDHTRAQLHAGTGLSLRQWTEAWLRETGYVEDLRRSEKNRETAENRVKSLLDLVASMDEVAPALPMEEQLSGFLERLALDDDREEENEDAGEAVTLITMHSCKGLEFPQVHLVGLEDGLLPHARSKEEGTLDEERRLFYVALTRAQRSLTLSHCAARRKYGTLTPCRPSPFLQELPAELVDEGGSSRPVTQQSGRELFAGLRAALDS